MTSSQSGLPSLLIYKAEPDFKGVSNIFREMLKTIQNICGHPFTFNARHHLAN